MTVAQAGPIGLLAVGIAAAMGAVIGLRAKMVRYRAALLIAGTGILMAPVGMWLAQQLNTRILSVVFAIVLLWVAYKTIRESKQGAVSRLSRAWSRPAFGTRQATASSGPPNGACMC
jgi:uncharacterized membrane protein YfcA